MVEVGKGIGAGGKIKRVVVCGSQGGEMAIFDRPLNKKAPERARGPGVGGG